MKKLLATALTALMLMSLCCTSALAANGVDDPTSNTQVPVEITMDLDMAHKYLVDIDYPDPMVFTYSSAVQWDPDSYSYVSKENASTPDGWSDPQSIRITNHSDMPISYDATASVTNRNYGDLGISIGNGSGSIAACGIGTVRGSKFAEFSIGITGVPSDSLDGKQVTLGSVDIAIRP